MQALNEIYVPNLDLMKKGLRPDDYRLHQLVYKILMVPNLDLMKKGLRQASPVCHFLKSYIVPNLDLMKKGLRQLFHINYLVRRGFQVMFQT